VVIALRLEEIAPRLAKARDEYNAEVLARNKARAAERRYRLDQRLDMERLAAHRELQLIRACNTRRPGRYIKTRIGKNQWAQDELARQRQIEATL
jgi:hypothetical protein